MGVRPCVFKMLYKPGHRNVQSTIPAIVTVWTKHENFKADAADLDIDRFANNGIDGHQMDQTMAKTECRAKNQNFFF